MILGLGIANDKINYDLKASDMTITKHGIVTKVSFKFAGIQYHAKFAIKGSIFHYGDNKGWYGTMDLGLQIFGSHTFYMNIINMSKNIAKNWQNKGRLFSSEGALSISAQIFYKAYMGKM